MKSALFACLTSLGLLYSAVAHADIQPAELVAGNINMTGQFVVANIYVGGTYGQSYPGGRTATLEATVGGSRRVLWQGKLPTIRPGDGYYITVPYASPVKVTTTFRLSINGSDRDNSNNVRVVTFRAPIAMKDRIILGDTYVPKKIDPLKKIRIIPK